MKVLIVEDDQGILMALTLALQSEGHEVKSPSHGQDLIELINEFKPKAIVLDLLLGEKTGGELTKEIKSNPDTKNIPVIILSAHPHGNAIAMEAGADDFLAKPFQIDDLLAKITHNAAKYNN
jgi:DNA-binding response OmpR family regulator